LVDAQDIEVCNVCGDGKEVGDPDAVFEFPGQPTVPCGLLESDGQTGMIPAEFCGFLPDLVDAQCDCVPIDFAPVFVLPPIVIHA